MVVIVGGKKKKRKLSLPTNLSVAVNRYSILKELVKKYKARILYVVFRRYVLLHNKKTELLLGYKIKVAGRKYQFNSRWFFFCFVCFYTNNNNVFNWHELCLVIHLKLSLTTQQYHLAVVYFLLHNKNQTLLKTQDDVVPISCSGHAFRFSSFKTFFIWGSGITAVNGMLLSPIQMAK